MSGELISAIPSVIELEMGEDRGSDDVGGERHAGCFGAGWIA